MLNTFSVYIISWKKINMFDRYLLIDLNIEPLKIKIISDIHPQLIDQDYLDTKLKRDQQKLYTLVQYTKYEGDRKAFIHEYFGLPYDNNKGSDND